MYTLAATRNDIFPRRENSPEFRKFVETIVRRQEIIIVGEKILLRGRLGNWPLNEIRERGGASDSDGQAVLITSGRPKRDRLRK